MPDGPTVTTVVPLTTADLIQKFIQLRDKIAEIKKAQAKQLEPFIEMQTRLDGLLTQALNDAGLDSMRCDAGTVYRSTVRSVTVQDWPATFEFIQTNQLWDLLERRVSKTAAVAVIEETGKPIPGLKVDQASVLHVRRS